MILRDPVHGLVAFEGDEERVVHALLATAELQRLRRVRQLGLASLVFPGAEHSRFAHAVGTAWVMSRLLTRLSQVADLPPETRLDAEARRDAIAAALLHDLGHGPFSHLYEDVLRDAPGHESWTAALLLDRGTEVHAALESFGQGSAQRVADLMAGRHRVPYLASTISGALDVDRCDYLSRDSQMTGVRYGLYDLDWLLRALTVVHTGEAGGDSWALAVEGRKGLPPIEGFFLARNFMYQQVYHHKAVRAAEVLVRALFVRARELIAEGRPPAPAPAALVRDARGERPSVGEYLALDDAAISYAIAEWQHADDPILADLARRFQRRRLPKTLPLPDAELDVPRWLEARDVVAELVTRAGMRPDLHAWLDVPEDVPYAEPEQGPVLWVSLRHQPTARLGDVSFLLRELRNKRTRRPRLIFPPELRDSIVAALEPWLRASDAFVLGKS